MFKSMAITDPITGNPKCFSVPIVQELALQDPNTLPEKYLVPEENRPSVSLSLTYRDNSIPVIDMSILHENTKELEKLASAAQELGFFQVINHGIPGSLMGRMRSVAKGFFQLPMEEKLKYEMKNNQGYGQAFVVSEEQSLDWADMMYLYTLPVESRVLNQWPKTANFRETLHEYALETQILAKKLLTVLAEGLGINPDCFVESFGEFSGSVRTNHYPPCPRPDLVLGLSAHSDGAGITILLQDDECSWEALQVHKGEEWIPVPSIPDALVINIGDLLEILSNGRYKSIEHRVVTSKSKGRTSIATFYSLNKEKEVGPLLELIDGNHPCLYRKIKVSDYAQHYISNKLEGKKSLECLKIH
ncbi:hypothetical protein SUGI_0732310 [Cryptomeria japonica]|uniref:protein SRG1 n=1 Tax=Cryptomeria japonica TaxID=3369 RepID=UPI002414BA27|nr:protein SRG1 [Cryptomeria japonica]GLJ36466.1 hypothetical protein SUGI_0732310 [Cryptomeria japonica]